MRLLIQLIFVFALAGCASRSDSAEPVARAVLEKYEQGGRYYVSVTGPSDSIIQVEVEEAEWEEIKKGGTVFFDEDWDVTAIDGYER
ncbi:hypothetical protein [Cohnella thailandensis]|uniref:Uncharacterized protein n=1 Tax=Cohnella thailandensis TaxID=557557 RepID=A0A841SW67_9BACL|nr:hypothetical protein [Cohnella thailandensis]MBB6634428.1 hypothetical protein [Cohnella thailandensis]MBP1972072.1 trans-2-enoyl-CoA reductase [Cohnella thailandensis]